MWKQRNIKLVFCVHVPSYIFFVPPTICIICAFYVWVQFVSRWNSRCKSGVVCGSWDGGEEGEFLSEAERSTRKRRQSERTTRRASCQSRRETGRARSERDGESEITWSNVVLFCNGDLCNVRCLVSTLPLTAFLSATATCAAFLAATASPSLFSLHEIHTFYALCPFNALFKSAPQRPSFLAPP